MWSGRLHRRWHPEEGGRRGHPRLSLPDEKRGASRDRGLVFMRECRRMRRRSRGRERRVGISIESRGRLGLLSATAGVCQLAGSPTLEQAKAHQPRRAAMDFFPSLFPALHTPLCIDAIATTSSHPWLLLAPVAPTHFEHLFAASHKSTFLTSPSPRHHGTKLVGSRIATRPRLGRVLRTCGTAQHTLRRNVMRRPRMETPTPRQR